MNALDNLLARVGKTRASVAKSASTRMGKLLRRDGVPDSAEVQRVRALPRRWPRHPSLIDALHEVVCAPDCTERLRVHQAEALLDVVQYGVLFGPLRCGSGKTLLTLLIARLLEAKRPVLLIPAAHRTKAIRETADYRARGWLVELPELVSYTAVSNDPDLLDRLDPDLLVADEAHALRDLTSGRTIRVERWLQEHPSVPFIPLSGTLIGTSLTHWHHLAEWSLGPDRMPLPADPDECCVWAQALDPPDPRRQLATPLSLGALAWVGDREGWGQFVAQTPGIVSTPTRGCDAALEISRWRPTLSPKVKALIAEVGESGCRPDGELLSDAEIVDVQSQLALGFYYIWDPTPPDGWRESRGEWLDLVATYKRRRRRGFDTEGEIRAHVMRRGTPGERAILSAWADHWEAYRPPRKPIWLGDEILQQATDYARKHRAVIWHRYKAVGARFEALGLPHFGDQGLNSDGVYIENHDGPCSASIQSSGTGRNLQAWDHALVLTPPAAPEPWEQLLARHHREGQNSDVVRFAIVDSIEYHSETVRRVRDLADHLSKVAANEQKLTIASWV